MTTFNEYLTENREFSFDKYLYERAHFERTGKWSDEFRWEITYYYNMWKIQNNLIFNDDDYETIFLDEDDSEKIITQERMIEFMKDFESQFKI